MELLLVGSLSRWMALKILPTVKYITFYYFFITLIRERGTSLDKTESINEVKSLNSLCNVQKLEQVKPKMTFLVFFYNVVLLAFLLL